MNFNFFKKERKKLTNALAYSDSFNSNDSGNFLIEKLRGMISSDKVKFPKELGEKHPFDYKITDTLCKVYGQVDAIVDKHVDFIMSGGVQVKVNDDRGQTIINNFVDDFDVWNLIIPWIKEALKKGVGYLELGGNKQENINGLKVLNSNSMYVVRDDQGEIIKYNQYLKDIKQFNKFNNSKDVEPFEPYEIAQLNINVNADSAYGMGIVYPLIKHVNDLVGARKEMHKIMHRKAETPLIFVMGNKDKDDYPDPEEMQELGGKLDALEGKNNWVVTDYTKPMTVDFGNIGEKFEYIIENDTEALYSAAQVPAFLTGKASIPEGLAKEQMKAWMFRISGLQKEIGRILEFKLFKRVLNSNGIDANVEVIWGIPSEQEKIESIKNFNELIKNPFISEFIRKEANKKIATLMGIEDMSEIEEEQNKPKEPKPNDNNDNNEGNASTNRSEDKNKQPIVPGQNETYVTEVKKKFEPQTITFDSKVFNKEQALSWMKNKGHSTKNLIETEAKYIFQVKEPEMFMSGTFKWNTPENGVTVVSGIVKGNESCNDNFCTCGLTGTELETSKDMTVMEWVDFNYKKYNDNVINVTNFDNFDLLSAKTKNELRAGLFNQKEIDKLRTTMIEGFNQNLTIRQIEDLINKRIDVKDRLLLSEGEVVTKEDGNPVVTLPSRLRPITIARTETVRLSNLGAIQNYKQGGVEKVRWVATNDERLCPICTELHGQVMNIENSTNPPAHVMCRCTVVPVIE